MVSEFTADLKTIQLFKSSSELAVKQPNGYEQYSCDACYPKP